MILVGIPTLNGPDRLRRCLESMVRTAQLRADLVNHDVRVLVADDGSTPENLAANKAVIHQLVQRIPTLEMLFGHGRTGIARTWNRIVRHPPHASADIVVLVNDDIEVVDDWLDVIAFSLRENPTLGMLGLNTYCGTTLSQFPSEPRIDYREAKLLDGGGALLSSHGPIFAFRRALWEEVGGFDERYFVFFEELDLGVALRRRGYRHAMASYPICVHLGGATNSDPKNLDAARCLAESRAKFQEKWGCSLDELRAEFLADDRMTPPPPWREWCSQRKVWR